MFPGCGSVVKAWEIFFVGYFLLQVFSSSCFLMSWEWGAGSVHNGVVTMVIQWSTGSDNVGFSDIGDIGDIDDIGGV